MFSAAGTQAPSFEEYAADSWSTLYRSAYLLAGNHADAEDLAGSRIRVSDSDATMALLTAMGADPVQGMVSVDVGLGLRDGSLDGVELAPTFIRANNFQLTAPYLTSFALIPKFEVLAASGLLPLEQGRQDAGIGVHPG